MIFVIIGVFCIIIAFALNKSQNDFEKNCQFTMATIIGYYVEDNSSFDTPIVRFSDNGKTIETTAASIKDRNRPKVGSRLQIAFVKDSISGKDTYRVRLLENGDVAKKDRIGAVVLGIIGSIFLIAGLVIYLCYWR